MSLSQATSPEEAKRELRQQVFLAIQGKYDPRQTSQLIEDIDTITNAITGSLGVPKSSLGNSDKPTSFVDMDAPEKLIQSVRDKAMPGRTEVKAGESKPFLLVDSELKSQLYTFVVDKNGMPTINDLTPMRHHKVLGMIAGDKTYYRHHITVITGGWSFKRWFYCDEQNLSDWSETRLLGMLDYVNKFFADYKED